MDDKLNKMLLLGPHQCGKTTIFKQLRMQYANWYSEDEKTEFVAEIIGNMVVYMKALVEKTNRFIEFKLVTKIERAAAFILELDTQTADVHEVASAVSILWKYRTIRNTFDRISFPVPKSTLRYFFKRAKAIAVQGDEYHPSNQDIMYLDDMHTGNTDDQKYDLATEVLNFSNTHIEVCDITRQSDTIRWDKLFREVEVVLYVAPISEFDVVSDAEDNESILDEALLVFTRVANCAEFAHAELVLICNKVDQLKYKLETQPYSFNFMGYHGLREVKSICRYVRHMFQARTRRGLECGFISATSQNCDLKFVKHLVETRTLLNAIRNASINDVRLLLENKAHVNGELRGAYPLSAAVEAGNVGMIDLLLQYDADLSEIYNSAFSQDFDFQNSGVLDFLKSEFLFEKVHYIPHTDFHSFQLFAEEDLGEEYLAELQTPSITQQWGWKSLPVTLRIPYLGLIETQAGPHSLIEWHELNLLQNVPKSRHIIPLLAVCMDLKVKDQISMAIVTPYQAGGTLQDYVNSVRESGKTLSLNQLAQFSRGMVRALDHIHSNGFFHRDIALRNFLLHVHESLPSFSSLDESFDPNSQLSDPSFDRSYGQRVVMTGFHLSRKNDVTAPADAILPWKSCSPENLDSLHPQVWTIASEIWQFGIALWELLTNGKEPFQQVESVVRLQKVLRVSSSNSAPLEFPDHPPQSAMYHSYKAVIHKCCLIDPAHRPNTPALLKLLTNFAYHTADSSLTDLDIEVAFLKLRERPKFLPGSPQNGSSEIVIHQDDPVQKKTRALSVPSVFRNDMAMGRLHKLQIKFSEQKDVVANSLPGSMPSSRDRSRMPSDTDMGFSPLCNTDPTHHRYVVVHEPVLDFNEQNRGDVDDIIIQQQQEIEALKKHIEELKSKQCTTPKTPESRTSETRTSETRTSETGTSQNRTHWNRKHRNRTPQNRTSQTRTSITPMILTETPEIRTPKIRTHKISREQYNVACFQKCSQQ